MQIYCQEHHQIRLEDLKWVKHPKTALTEYIEWVEGITKTRKGGLQKPSCTPYLCQPQCTSYQFNNCSVVMRNETEQKQQMQRKRHMVIYSDDED